MSRFSRWGVLDRATFFSAGSKVWAGVAGILSLPLIARTLSVESQGFYYTFASLLALQVLLELGFSYVIVQVAAHEFALSRRHSDPSARDTARARLSSLLWLSLRWYAVIAVLFWLGCIGAGEYFFRATYAGDPAQWESPWLLAVTMFSASILLIPCYAVMDGCNEIAAVAKTRTIQDLCGFSLFWACLLLGGGLYAVAALYAGKVAGGSLGLLLTGLVRRIREMLAARLAGASPISWRREILPFQWKIALSWISGYFIFQLVSPALFAAQGAKVAGQAGMTIAIYSGVNSVMLTWISSKVPLFCEMIALQRWPELGRLFRRAVLTSSAIMAVGLCLLTGLFCLSARYFPQLSDRILGPGALVCFALTALVNHLVFSFAAYLRAFKEEPFLVPSIVGAVLNAVCVIGFARLSAFAVAAGYCAISALIMLPWAARIFLAKQRSLAPVQPASPNTEYRVSGP